MRNFEMTRSVARALQSEYPVGDPFGGPAYGEKTEVFSALAAVVSWMAGAEVVITAVTVFQAIAAVGIISSVAGLVTGNEDLIKFGSVVGIVGGIGAFAAGAGMFGVNEAAAGSSGLTGTAEGVELASPSLSNVTVDELGNSILPGEAASIAPPAVDTGLQDSNLLNPNDPVLQAQGDPGAQGVPPPANALPAPVDGNPGQALANNAAASSGVDLKGIPTGPEGTDPFTNYFGGEGSPFNFGSGSATGGAGGLKGLMDTFNKFSKDNPVMAFSMMQGASNMIGGMFDTTKPAQVDYYRAQASNANAQSALTQQQLLNMRQPLPVGSGPRPPVTPAGLINTRMA